jgi:hypothetical protein
MKVAALNPAVRVKAGRNFYPDLWIRVQRRRGPMSTPTLEKRLALDNSRRGRKLHRLHWLPNFAPAARAEFAQRVVFRANTLQI